VALRVSVVPRGGVWGRRKRAAVDLALSEDRA